MFNTYFINEIILNYDQNKPWYDSHGNKDVLISRLCL